MAGIAYANREVCDLIFYDYATNKPFMSFDLANTTGYSLDGEAVYAYGGASHPRRVQFTGERNGQFTVETQMQTTKLYQLITGADKVTGAKFVQRDELTADTNGKITLTKTPIDGTLFVYDADDDCGEALDATASGKEVTVDGATAGDSLVAYYMIQIEKATTLKITTKNFPRACRIMASTIFKTEDDEIVPYKLIAYKAAAQPSMEISLANTGDPTSITITFDLMADKNGDILDLIMVEDEENP